MIVIPPLPLTAAPTPPAALALTSGVSFLISSNVGQWLIGSGLIQIHYSNNVLKTVEARTFLHKRVHRIKEPKSMSR